jgi:hypothetical protein
VMKRFSEASAFGILNMRRLWFSAGNLTRDIAALSNHEMLPWDIWGAIGRQDSELDLSFFDQLAIVSSEPDVHIEKLIALHCDERVSVPRTTCSMPSLSVFRSCKELCSRKGFAYPCAPRRPCQAGPLAWRLFWYTTAVATTLAGRPVYPRLAANFLCRESWQNRTTNGLMRSNKRSI